MFRFVSIALNFWLLAFIKLELHINTVMIITVFMCSVYNMSCIFFCEKTDAMQTNIKKHDRIYEIGRKIQTQEQEQKR